MKKILKIFSIFLGIFLLIIFSYFFIGKVSQAKEIEWGVNFSQKHSQNLGLEWKKNYLALLEDLKVKKIKLITHWDLIEPEKDKYNFEDLDWQIQKANENKAKVLLVIGMKTGRWPECHLPEWAKNLSKRDQEKEILEILKEIVLRYKNSEAVEYWQIENEPFFPFGVCPKIEESFVKKEIELVKSLDSRPIIFVDSGEFSFWIKAAKLGDIVGVTLHRKVYFKEIKKYISYPFPPIYYSRKAFLTKTFFKKKVINSELQAEPWCKTLIYDCPLNEQMITMNLEQFRKNVEFAKKTGFDTFYFWGAEWWYWLKTKQNQPQIWQEAKNYFK